MRIGAIKTATMRMTRQYGMEMSKTERRRFDAFREISNRKQVEAPNCVTIRQMETNILGTTGAN